MQVPCHRTHATGPEKANARIAKFGNTHAGRTKLWAAIRRAFERGD